MARKRWCAIPVVIICCGIGLLYTGKQKSKAVNVLDLTQQEETVIEETIDVAIEESKEIIGVPETDQSADVWELVEGMLDHQDLGGITMIDVIPGKVEKDSYKRYLISCQVLGVNQSEEIDLYDYYMILQENEIGDFVMLPLGLQIMKTQPYETKKEIMSSALKLTNGWESPHPELEKKMANKVNDMNEIGGIYHAQEIIDYMSRYLNEWSTAIKTKDGTKLEAYYLPDTELYKSYKVFMEQIQDPSIQMDIYDMEIINIVCKDEESIFEVTTKGKIKTYLEDQINRYTKEISYTIREDENGFKILEARTQNTEMNKKE